jgi:Ataxin-1 and HBP1 module (AXH)
LWFFEFADGFFFCGVQVAVEACEDHPFFVVGKGWSSTSPAATHARFGLQVAQLVAGDTCISLSYKEPDVTNAGKTIKRLRFILKCYFLECYYTLAMMVRREYFMVIHFQGSQTWLDWKFRAACWNAIHVPWILPHSLIWLSILGYLP